MKLVTLSDGRDETELSSPVSPVTFFSRQGNIPAEKALVARSKVYVVFKSVFVTEM